MTALLENKNGLQALTAAPIDYSITPQNDVLQHPFSSVAPCVSGAMTTPIL